MMTAPVAIKTENMSRCFGDLVAVDNLNLSIASGSIYGFLGPNGSGKSTSIRMLTGLLSPSSGKIEVLGHPLPSEASKLRSRIGYMTQKFSLYSDLTVEENLRFISKIYNITGKALRNRIGLMCEQYGLSDIRHHMTSSLSGGQRQRLALAAAVVHDPDLLFLDEPTSAVDPESRREFWERLFDLCNSGKTILVSTHHMDEAERCHALAILDHGKKCIDGSPQQLIAEMHGRVVEVESEGADMRHIRRSLIALPEIISAAQLGSRLRVLVRNSIENPERFLRDHTDPSIALQEVRPSLEDVFVTVTGGHSGDT